MTKPFIFLAGLLIVIFCTPLKGEKIKVPGKLVSKTIYYDETGKISKIEHGCEGTKGTCYTLITQGAGIKTNSPVVIESGGDKLSGQLLEYVVKNEKNSGSFNAAHLFLIRLVD